MNSDAVRWPADIWLQWVNPTVTLVVRHPERPLTPDELRLIVDIVEDIETMRNEIGLGRC